MHDTPEVMTVEEVADYLRLSRVTIYRMFNSGALPFYVVGGRRRIRREDVEALLRPDGEAS